MSRTSAITADTVAAAAQALIDAGQDVTNKSVLDQIGSGSMSTLVPLLRAWREEQGERQDLASVAVPDALSGHAAEFAARTWRAALDQASIGHDAMRRDLAETRAEAERVQAELLTDIAAIEADRDQMQDDLAAALEISAAQGAQIADMQRDAAGLAERVTAREAEATTAREMSKAAQGREAAMRAERDEARAKIDAAVAETKSVRTDLGRQLTDLRAKHEQQAESLTLMHADLGTARADLATERAQHSATRDKLADAGARAKSDAEAVKSAMADMRGERDRALAAGEQMRLEFAQAHRAAAERAGKGVARADADHGASPGQTS